MQKLKTKDVIGGPSPMRTFHATCANCKEIEQTIGSMQRCSKCNAVYYCNRDSLESSSQESLQGSTVFHPRQRRLLTG